MAGLVDKVETYGAGFRSLGLDTMADRLLCVFRHQPLQFRFCGFMSQERGLCFTVSSREFCPGVRCCHIHDLDRFKTGFRWFDAEQTRGLAVEDASPEFLFRR